jgi:hypothetical protein
MGDSRLAKVGLIVAGISFVFGLTSFRFSKVVLANAAASSSSSSTRTSALVPGNLVYLNIKNLTDSWNGGTDASLQGTYKYAFKFFASETDTSDNWSSFAARAVGGDRFYCTTIPSKTGVNFWYGMRVYCYLSSATIVANDSPIAITNLKDASGLPVNQIEVTFGPNKLVGSTTSPAYVSFNTSDNTSYSDSSVDTNKLSIWSNYFLSETGTVCQSESKKTLLDYYWPTYASSFGNLSSTAKASFKTYSALNVPSTSTASNTISSAAGRYDYVMAKYDSDTTINDFADRSATKAAAVVVS